VRLDDDPASGFHRRADWGFHEAVRQLSGPATSPSRWAVKSWPRHGLDPEKVTVKIGDTVTWENFNRAGHQGYTGLDETQPLPPTFGPVGQSTCGLNQTGTYRYSVFTATDRV